MKYAFLILGIVFAGCTSTDSVAGGASQAETYVEFAVTNISNITIHAISTSGDAFFIDSSQDYFNDAGDKADGSAVTAYIANLNAKNLVLIPSHHHADHIGGMIKVAEIFNITKVWDTGSKYQTQTTKQFFSLVKGKVRTVRRGDIIKDGNLEFIILSPPSKLFSDENDNSIVYKLKYKNFTMIFTGDCELACENSMLKAGLDLKADVLKTGHHGSRSSTSDAFLNAVSPKTAIIGVAADNQYGHPHQEVIERLTAYKIEIYRTDLDGNIRIQTNGAYFDVLKEE